MTSNRPCGCMELMNPCVTGLREPAMETPISHMSNQESGST